VHVTPARNPRFIENIECPIDLAFVTGIGGGGSSGSSFGVPVRASLTS